MGVPICLCTKDPGNVYVPYADFSLENTNNQRKTQKILNSQINYNKDSICLQKGNNINSFFNNQNNQNDLNHFDLSLSPISNGRKNISINIININNDSSKLNINNCSKTNLTGLNNITTEKVYEQMKYKSGNEPAKEESFEKKDNNIEEESLSKIEEAESNLEEKKKEAIEKFDKMIIEFAEYITDDKLDEAERSIIKKFEHSLDEISVNSNYPKKIFSRPALLFKKDNSIYKGSWNFQGKKEGFGIFLDSKGNKYIGEWKDDKIKGKGRIISINGDYYEGYFNDGIIEGYGIHYSKTNGYKYYGQFKNNKFHGKGKLVYEDQTSYEGYFFEGCAFYGTTFAG